jgi:peptidoglycan/LPS O-acetylase OafA/YrhL
MASEVATSVERGTSNQSNRYYRPELDILRFIAAALVIQFHLVPSGQGMSLVERSVRAFHRSGACGVCLFFLLSAFLITELFLREIEAASTVHIPSFYVRRILRIWPLFFFVLLLAFIIGAILPKAAVSHSTLIAFICLAGNWHMIFHGWPSGFISPLWSISVEEQFYAVWPAIVKSGGRKAIAACSVFFWCLAYITLLILGARRSTFDPGAWLNSFVQFQFFAIGAALALLLHDRRIRLKSYVRLISFAAGLVAITLANPVSHLIDTGNMTHTSAAVPGYLWADLGCVLLFLSLLGTAPPAWCKPFIYLGKISYGLYLFHIFAWYLVAEWINGHLRIAHSDMMIGLLSFPLTIGLAVLSYHLLESPFLRLKKRFTFIPSREV